MPQAEEPSPEIDRKATDAARSYAIGSWLFLRALGVVSLIAFVSARVQIDGLIGTRGLFPAELWLEDLSAQGSGFWQEPTLAWLGADTSALHAICYLGMAASVFVMLGRFCIPALLVCFASYLSIVNVGASFFAYQWDALLLETTLVAIPLSAALRPDPWRREGRGPRRYPALARYALYFLNWRLVFCSGIVKLGGPTWQDLSALRYHYWTQPLPGPLSWHVHQLPEAVHSASVLAMLFLELALPCALLIPGSPRRVGALGLIVLQLAFMLTGNFGWFNLLAITLCLAALDDAFWSRKLPRRLLPGVPSPGPARRRWRQVMAGALMIIAVIPTAGTIFGWRHMPAAIGNFYVTLSRFRPVSPYGLFARMTTSRVEFIYEGTGDGERWRTYRFRYKPDVPEELPNQSAPHLPRLDWGLWFAALGHPSYAPLVEELRTALERAEPDVLDLLEHDPFDGERPRQVRVRRVEQRFSTRAEHDAQDVYWIQRRLD